MENVTYTVNVTPMVGGTSKVYRGTCWAKYDFTPPLPEDLQDDVERMVQANGRREQDSKDVLVCTGRRTTETSAFVVRGLHRRCMAAHSESDHAVKVGQAATSLIEDALSYKRVSYVLKEAA